MQHKGFVLILTFWVLILLIIFSISLTRRALLNLRISYYQQDRLKALNFAKAGVKYAIDLLDKDMKDFQTKNYDSIFECGVNLKGKSPQDIFKRNFGNKNDGFIIGYKNLDGDFIYGVQDIQAKININNLKNENFIKEGLIFSGFEKDAVDLSIKIKEWINELKEDDEEKRHYKNSKLKIEEELLLILEDFYKDKDLAKENYNKIREIFTTFGDNKININTASFEVLTIITNAIVKANSKELSLTPIIVEKIISYRSQKVFKNEQEIVDFLSEEDDLREIFEEMKDYLTTKSDYFKINVVGRANKVVKNITTIYDRKNRKIIYYHTN